MISTRWRNSTKRFAFFAFIAIDSSFRINENARLSFIAFCFYPNFGYVRCLGEFEKERANYWAGLSPHRFILIYFHLYIRNSNCIMPNSTRRRRLTIDVWIIWWAKRDKFFFYLAALIFGSYLFLVLPVVDLFFFSGSSLVRSTLLSQW